MGTIANILRFESRNGGRSRRKYGNELSGCVTITMANDNWLKLLPTNTETLL